MNIIQEEIQRLVFVSQSLTHQRLNALLKGRQSEAQQIESVQVDIDNKIQELEVQHFDNQAVS
jgi:ABC-type uncharacterized transport system substrate-binding protein